MSMMRVARTTLTALTAVWFTALPDALGAQAKSASPRRTTAAPKAPSRPAPSRPASSTTRAGAWTLPDADALVQRVYSRIIAQDKPGAVPISAYTRRFVGRDTTIEAVRRFAGRDVTLASSAFGPVTGWTDSNALQIPPCVGPGCPAPVNSLWLAITRIERGELPHEVHVWYTTSFAAEGPAGPTQQSYAFCERWLRVGGGWKYDGFVRVASSSDRGE